MHYIRISYQARRYRYEGEPSHDLVNLTTGISRLYKSSNLTNTQSELINKSTRMAGTFNILMSNNTQNDCSISTSTILTQYSPHLLATARPIHPPRPPPNPDPNPSAENVIALPFSLSRTKQDKPALNPIEHTSRPNKQHMAFWKLKSDTAL